MSNKSPFGTASHFSNMETWGRHRKMETNGLGDHKPKHLFQTSVWQAWVAWNERGQILGTENVRRKIIRIHHWFTTQTSTLAMFELDSQLNNPPLPTFWCLHELNVFATKNSGNGFLKKTCRTNLLSTLNFILRTWKHGADIERWKQTALEATNQNIYLKLHCDRHELLGTSEDKFLVQKMYDEK